MSVSMPKELATMVNVPASEKRSSHVLASKVNVPMREPYLPST